MATAASCKTNIQAGILWLEAKRNEFMEQVSDFARRTGRVLSYATIFQSQSLAAGLVDYYTRLEAARTRLYNDAQACVPLAGSDPDVAGLVRSAVTAIREAETIMEAYRGSALYQGRADRVSEVAQYAIERPQEVAAATTARIERARVYLDAAGSVYGGVQDIVRGEQPEPSGWDLPTSARMALMIAAGGGLGLGAIYVMKRFGLLGA